LASKANPEAHGEHQRPHETPPSRKGLRRQSWQILAGQKQIPSRADDSSRITDGMFVLEMSFPGLGTEFDQNSGERRTSLPCENPWNRPARPWQKCGSNPRSTRSLPMRRFLLESGRTIGDPCQGRKLSNHGNEILGLTPTSPANFSIGDCQESGGARCLPAVRGRTSPARATPNPRFDSTIGLSSTASFPLR
jgi:hypothetical protein